MLPFSLQDGFKNLLEFATEAHICISENISIPVHDDVIKWKHFPRNWPFVREIHRSPVNCPHKGQWRGALMFSLIYAWINDWVNNREAGDLRRQHGHYDVIVMWISTRMMSCSTWRRFCCPVDVQRSGRKHMDLLPRMPGTFSAPPRVSDPGIHHGTCAAAIWQEAHGLLVR